MNTAPDTPRAARETSLYEAVAQLERHFGAAFVHNRVRWRTADGVISYRALHLYADVRRQQLAEERLHLSRAAMIARGGHHAHTLAQADEEVARGAA